MQDVTASKDAPPPLDPRIAAQALDVMHSDPMQLVRFVWDLHLGHAPSERAVRKALQAANRIHARHVTTLANL